MKQTQISIQLHSLCLGCLGASPSTPDSHFLQTLGARSSNPPSWKEICIHVGDCADTPHTGSASGILNPVLGRFTLRPGLTPSIPLDLRLQHQLNFTPAFLAVWLARARSWGFPGSRTLKEISSHASLYISYGLCVSGELSHGENRKHWTLQSMDRYTCWRRRCKDVRGCVYVCVHAEQESKLFENIFKHFLILNHLQVDMKHFYLGMNCILCFTLHICPLLDQSYAKAHAYVQPQLAEQSNRVKHLHDCFIADPNILSLSSIIQFTNSINSYRHCPGFWGAPGEHIPPSSPVFLGQPRPPLCWGPPHPESFDPDCWEGLGFCIMFSTR